MQIYIGQSLIQPEREGLLWPLLRDWELQAVLRTFRETDECTISQE